MLTGGDKLQGYVKRSYGLVNNYGPTENAVVTTSYVVDRNRDNIPVGKPISNTRAYILGSGDHLQPVGVAGELCIAGDGLARGYLNNPGFTAEKFTIMKSFAGVQGAVFQKSPLVAEGKLYRTGDLARWLADGNIEFMGRVDQQVKIRGYRIEPGEVEKLLLNHDGIEAAIVLARERKGDVDRYLCAYYAAAKKAADTLDPGGLKEYLSGKLPAYMVPRYFVEIDEIPLTANGKVDRRALPEPGVEGRAAREGYEPPGNEIEEKMVEIWQDVLGIPRPGINDNFFEIGGDSIKAIQVTARLRTNGLELKISDLFLHPTVKESAKCVIIRQEAAEEEPPVPVAPGLSRLNDEELEAFEDDFSDID
jgi:aryl carrier-like protein